MDGPSQGGFNAAPIGGFNHGVKRRIMREVMVHGYPPRIIIGAGWGECVQECNNGLYIRYIRYYKCLIYRDIQIPDKPEFDRLFCLFRYS